MEKTTATIKSVGLSGTGKNWSVETDQGKFNIPKKNHPEQPLLTLGQSYTFEWKWFEFQINGEPAKMRMVNTWNSPEGDPVPQRPLTTNPPATQQTHVPVNGQALGNRRTNAVNLVIAQIQAKTVQADQASIRTALQYWDTVFLEHEKSGTYEEIPF